MVREQIDTVDALMARYVAGSLPEPARVLVAAHLDMKPDNRALVSDLNRLAGEALELAPSAPLTDREARLQAIFGSTPPTIVHPQSPVGDTIKLFPRVLRDFIGFDAEDIPWRTRLPGFREYEIGDIDGCEVSLLWIRAGRAIPSHTHRGIELTLVIDGAYNDATGRFARGDISVADDSIDHRPVAEKAGPCIALTVMDAPIKLTGSFTRIIGDLIG